MDETRRLSFGSVAELYDAARPSYPPALIDDVIAFAAVTPGDRALEVGAGTGKATELFAARGLEILALEPSHDMAALASRRVASAEVEVRITDFESAEVPEHAFALVYSAQAWHWVDPDRRYALARRALATGGALAVFWNQADWSDSPLAGELRAAYERSGATLIDHGPMYPGEPGPLDLGADWHEQIAAAAGLGAAEARRYPWSCEYTAQEYVDLLGTHSDHIVLEPAARLRLYDEVAATIERDGGSFTLAYSTLMCVARAI